MKQHFRLFLFMLLATGTVSCYNFRVSSAHFDPSTTYHSKRVNSFFWGLVQKRENGVDVVVTNCDSLNIHSIDEVRVSTNLGYSFITVLTLGIWCPMKIEWRCAKPCAREGIIP